MISVSYSSKMRRSGGGGGEGSCSSSTKQYCQRDCSSILDVYRGACTGVLLTDVAPAVRQGYVS